MRVRPLPVDAYDVTPAEREVLEDARARLTTLFDGGRARAPAALARAHAAYECWLEEDNGGDWRKKQQIAFLAFLRGKK